MKKAIKVGAIVLVAAFVAGYAVAKYTKDVRRPRRHSYPKDGTQPMIRGW